MKKLITATFVCFTLVFSSVARADIDPRVKMVGTMAGYGVVGGALLGTASLAFGSSGRSIAKGASLGLYAGIIFGSYVIFNYEMKKRGFGAETKENYYPESDSPYDNNDQTNILVDINEYRLAQFESKKDPKKEPKFFMNFLNYEF